MPCFQQHLDAVQGAANGHINIGGVIACCQCAIRDKLKAGISYPVVEMLHSVNETEYGVVLIGFVVYLTVHVFHLH